MSVIDQLRTAVREDRRTGRAIAQDSGLREETISRFLNGKVPSAEVVDKLASVVGVELARRPDAPPQRDAADPKAWKPGDPPHPNGWLNRLASPDQRGVGTDSTSPRAGTHGNAHAPVGRVSHR